MMYYVFNWILVSWFNIFCLLHIWYLNSQTRKFYSSKVWNIIRLLRNLSIRCFNWCVSFKWGSGILHVGQEVLFVFSTSGPDSEFPNLHHLCFIWSPSNSSCFWNSYCGNIFESHLPRYDQYFLKSLTQVRNIKYFYQFIVFQTAQLINTGIFWPEVDNNE